MQFILPLFDEAAWANNQAAAEVATSHEFLYEQAGHDGFSRTGVIGKQKAKRLPGQHRFINSRDLMRQWINE
jgi:hypothetical protein